MRGRRWPTWPIAQRDADGLIHLSMSGVDYVRSSRQGQFFACFTHRARRAAKAHGFRPAVCAFQNFLRRRGMVVVFSDSTRTRDRGAHRRALRYRGNDLILFHVLDRRNWRRPSRTGGSGTWRSAPPWKCARVRAPRVRRKIESTGRCVRRRAPRAIDCFLMNTGRPLDESLREYLTVRQGRCRWVPGSMVLAGLAAVGLRCGCTAAPVHRNVPVPFSSLRSSSAVPEFRKAPPASFICCCLRCEPWSLCCWRWP